MSKIINKIINKRSVFIVITAYMVLASPSSAYAMHISEGILPLRWAGIWFIVILPFLALGIASIKKSSEELPASMPLIGMISAAVFIISAMPVPVPMAGTCSHPAGTGLAAILVGPFVTTVITSVALLVQALFLAHGGITTLGANIFSMGVAGAFTGYFIYKAAIKLKVPLMPAAFLAGLFSDWATYAATAVELALGLSEKGSSLTLLKAILVAFMPTQMPLGLLEGFAAAGFFAYVLNRRPDILMKLGAIAKSETSGKDTVYEESAF